jgi:hypothetical protein
MTKNTKTLATILVVVIIISALFLVYYFFFKPEEGALVGGGLVREDAQSGEAGSITNFDSLTSQTGRELLFLLDDLRSISFDSEFIQGAAFANLEDFSRPLEPQTPGRENPFSPIQ